MFFVLQVLFTWAQTQDVQEIKGRVVDSKSQEPITAVMVMIQENNQMALTDENGNFVLKNVPIGQHFIILNYSGYNTRRLPIILDLDSPLDLTTLFLEEDSSNEAQITLISLTDDDLGDDNSGSETTSGLLQASRDVFQQSAAFNWGQARFKVRGLDNEYGKTLMNGIVMNKVLDGRPQWGNWGGLNDVTRSQEFAMGSSPSDYVFGGILGTQAISTRASHMRKGARITASAANTNYSARTLATYSSGLNNKGWAYSISASYRGAKEGHFEGTDYDAKSFFAAIEKKINNHHSLNFTGIYAQNKRGKNAPLTDEVSELMGHKYNSYWGWQGNDKRNSRYKNVEEPIFMLTHYWKINEDNSLTTTASYQFGKIGNSRLSYRNIENPDPTYYRNLPSYALNQFDNDGNFTPDFETAELKRIDFLENSQINWAELYEANLANKNNESKVFLYEDRTDDKNLSFNSNFRSRLSNHIVFDAGLNYRRLKSSNFKYSLDLLGGIGFLDIDHYQTGDAQQSNMNDPNRHVGNHEKFGYNYDLFANVIDVFTQLNFEYNRFNFYLAQNISYTSYQREGKYKNGIYIENSQGKSENVTFNNFGFKGGMTYHITGRHALNMNVAFMNQAPNLKTTFANARLNNNVTPDLKSENIFSIDGSYLIRTPKLKARITGYLSEIKNTSNIGFYYADGVGILDSDGNLLGGNGNAFVGEILTGANKRNLGGELGLEYQLTQTLKAKASAAYGQSFYTNNPNLKLNSDNAKGTFDYGTTYLKNYRVASGPQTALSLGLEYRDPKFWWIAANINYFDENYISVSPLLRTNNFIKDPENGGMPFDDLSDDKIRDILKQQKLNDFALFNISGGKSWRLPNRSIIGFFASVNNVFNETYKSGGFEQARNANYQKVSQDMASGTRTFGNKYFYGYGRNFFANLYYNF